MYQLQLLINTIPKKLTEDRIQKPCLDEKGKGAKRIYDYQQWLERFKQYTKRKNIKDIRPLIKERTISDTEWNANEEKLPQDFLWSLGAEQPIKGRTEPDKIEINKLNKPYDKLYLPKRIENNRGETFWAKQSEQKHRRTNVRNCSNWKKSV